MGSDIDFAPATASCSPAPQSWQHFQNDPEWTRQMQWPIAIKYCPLAFVTAGAADGLAVQRGVTTTKDAKNTKRVFARL